MVLKERVAIDNIEKCIIHEKIKHFLNEEITATKTPFPFYIKKICKQGFDDLLNAFRGHPKLIFCKN